MAANSGVPWLDVARQMSGLHEFVGGADNPVILGMATFIGKQYKDMADYCGQYRHDSIPWCGLNVAFDLAKAGFRPVYDPKSDLKSFLWADAWRLYGQKLAKPMPGAIMVFTRNGGGHVSLYEGEDKNWFYVRGGNQSDAINLMRISKDKLTEDGIRWPTEFRLVSVPGQLDNFVIGTKVS